MIELALGTMLVALSALALRALRRDEPLDPAEPAAAEVEPPEAPRGLRVGDVLLVATDSLWLAGALRLRERPRAAPVLTLFAAPVTGGLRWVAQLDPAATELAVLGPAEGLPAAPWPAELRVDGLRLDRRRAQTLDVEVEGEEVPHHVTRARLEWYEGAAGRILVGLDLPRGERLDLLGERLGPHLIDLLPGGDAVRRG